MNRKYKTVGLMDHMGYGNMGDAAIQEAFIANIKSRLPDARLIGFSLYPDDTRKRHNIETYPIRWSYPRGEGSDRSPSEAPEPNSRLKTFLKNRRIFYRLAKPVHDVFQELAHLWRSYRVVKSLDVLVMSGGGQLCELHGDLPYNVFKFTMLARLAKTPVCIVGVGADLLKRPINRFFARWAVRSAHYVSLRSIESQALVDSLGVKKETHVCPDPAYALDVREYLGSPEVLGVAEARGLFRNIGIDLESPAPRDLASSGAVAAEPGVSISSQKPVAKVGLNPMSFCDPRRWPRKDAAVYERFMGALTDFSSWLLAEGYALEIYCSDMMDFYSLEDLRERLQISPIAAPNLTFRPALTLRELFRQMSAFDFVVTSKFHGVIFSHLLGKPVMALSYLPKFHHLMQAVGHEQYCMEAEQVTAGWLIEQFKRMVSESDQLRTLFRETSARYSKELAAEFDKVFLRPAGTREHEFIEQGVTRDEFSTAG
ncbi:MAG TPA: polysaccharide pyruvyl transferase family protein [Terriglobia bacterium]|nr:polysaccharide pyruvyl transferase family protein [Terriglobia bacterium]